MPWSPTSARAARLWDSTTHAEVGHLSGTSTSSMRPERGSSTVCVFGVETDSFVDLRGDPFASADDFGADNTRDSAEYCGQADVIRYLRQAGVEGTRPLGIRSRAETGRYPLFPTCVPRAQRGIVTWSIAVLDDGGASTTLLENTDQSVAYKDPSVLRLGHQSIWLMVLMRERSPAVDPGDHTTPTTGPMNAIGDIVGFLSDSPYFDDSANVTGPFWLASSLRAWPDDTQARYWLSVPTAAVWHGKLFLYYVAEQGRLGSASATITDPSPGTHLHAAGIACRRISIADLLAATPIGEDLWEASAEEFEDNLVPGTELGALRFWLAGNRPEGHVRAFTRTFHDAEPVDPDCLGCDESFSLFFAAITTKTNEEDRNVIGPGLGFGIWRASPLEPRTTLVDDSDGGASVTTVAGLDFVMRARWTAGDSFADSDDQVGESVRDEAMFMDPDAVLQRDGGVRVMVGWFDRTDSTFGEWVMFTGDRDDACRPAEECWRVEEDAAAAEDGQAGMGDVDADPGTVIWRAGPGVQGGSPGGRTGIPDGTRILVEAAELERVFAGLPPLRRAPAEPPCACERGS
jgi:hypothetical protein